MSKDYNHEIGFESLIADFKRYNKQTPKGVTLVKEGRNIYLQFKTNNKPRSKYKCACSFTLDGMVEALSKANKVADKLKESSSETEFWQWYDSTIKESVNLKDDQLTLATAIALVEKGFWGRNDRRGEPRIKGHPSHERSYYNTYGQYYRKLDGDKKVTTQCVIDTLNTWEKGLKTYKDALSAFKYLARLCKHDSLLKLLDDIDGRQTKFQDRQEIDLESFMKWRLEALGTTKPLDGRSSLEVRKQGLWVLGMQIIYGLRISEVFAIKNLTGKAYDARGKSVCDAYNDTENNPHRLIYIGKETNLGTTVKTGARLARPMFSTRFPNLYTDWELEIPRLPENRPEEDSNFQVVCKFHGNLIRNWLVRWNAPFTQTHADRRLGNLLGEMGGVPQEIRARSMGHTVASNSRYYKTGSYQTQIDLLTQSNAQAIDFVTALNEA